MRYGEELDGNYSDWYCLWVWFCGVEMKSSVLWCVFVGCVFVGDEWEWVLGNMRLVFTGYRVLQLDKQSCEHAGAVECGWLVVVLD